jgi:hypothetical protein
MIADFIPNCSNQFDIYSPEKEKFRVEIRDSIVGFETEWNKQFSDYYPLPVGSMLQSMEHSSINDVVYKYAVVSKGNEIFALLNFQLLSVSQKHYPDFSSLSTAACNLYKIFSGRKYLGLVSGHLFITDFPSFVCKKQTEKYFWMKEKVVSRLSKQLDVDVVLLKDLQSKEEEFWKEHKKFSLLKDDLFMEMMIRPDWVNISDYKTALSKKYLARIQKMMDAPSVAAKIELSSTFIEKHKEELGALYFQVVEKSSVKMGILNRDYFLNMKNTLGDNFKVYGYFSGGKLQAFASYLIIGKQLELYYIGMNYLDQGHRELYPMMMLDALTEAIEGGFKQFRLGRTALEAKAILGCKPRSIINLVYFRNRWLRYMMNYLLKVAAIERGESWKLRNPFRESLNETALKNN